MTLSSHGRLNRSHVAVWAVGAAAALTLTGCSQGQDVAKQAATGLGDAAKTAASGAGDAAKTAANGVGDAAKTAATSASQAALATAAKPVIDLLTKADGQLKGGNLAAVASTMGGFGAIWATASPVLKPLVGDKWDTLEKAATALQGVFAKGTPSAADAGSAITGLMGPLSALLAR